MTIGNVKLTQNEQLVINALASILGGAIIGATQGTYQYLTQAGQVNMSAAVSFAAIGFWGLLSAALFAYVPAHAQQELAAAKDAETQLRQVLDGVSSTPPVNVLTVPSTSQIASQPSPVTIHIVGATPTLTSSNATTPATLASISQLVNSAQSLADIGPIAATPVDPDVTETQLKTVGK
jgi:hypothetical protein